MTQVSSVSGDEVKEEFGSSGDTAGDFCRMNQLKLVLDGMLVHPKHFVAATQPGRKETIWSKVSYLRKECHGRDQTLSHRPLDLQSSAVTTTPLSTHEKRCATINCAGCLWQTALSLRSNSFLPGMPVVDRVEFEVEFFFTRDACGRPR